MTKRRKIASAPEPLEAYASHFDDLFERSSQRDEFRRYLEGLLLPSERNKTLTGLVNTEPLVGAQFPRAQKLQWFLSESNWEERQVQAERLKLLRENPATAPTAQGALVIDETGDRKDGHHTAHVARQYLGNVGKIENGVVSVSSLWADEDVYYPLEVEPYTRGVLFCRWQERSRVSDQAADCLAARPAGERIELAIAGRRGRLALRGGSRPENGPAPVAGPLVLASIQLTPGGILREWQARPKKWPAKPGGSVPSGLVAGSISPEPFVMAAPRTGGLWKL